MTIKREDFDPDIIMAEIQAYNGGLLDAEYGVNISKDYPKELQEAYKEGLYSYQKTNKG